MRKYNGDDVAVELKVQLTEKKGNGLFYSGENSLNKNDLIGLYLGKIHFVTERAPLINSNYIMMYQFTKDFYIDAEKFGKIM